MEDKAYGFLAQHCAGKQNCGNFGTNANIHSNT